MAVAPASCCWVLAGLLLSLCPGCCSSGGEETRRFEELRRTAGLAEVERAALAFAPQTLDVLLLSSVVPDRSGYALDLFVAAQDRYGFRTRGLGVLTAELRIDSGAAGDEGRRAGLWRFDMRDPDQNAAAYDRISLAYRLRLEGLGREIVGQRLRIIVSFEVVGPYGRVRQIKDVATLRA